MKKRRKIFQRAAALLCCILLLPSLVAVPALAESDNGFFNVLEFGTANGSGSQVLTGTLPFDVVYETTKEPFFYVDMVVVSDYAIQITYAGLGLNRQLIDNQNGVYRYRFYGNLVGDPSGYLTFHIYYSSSVNATVIFEQLRVSSFKSELVPSVGTVLASPYEYVPSESMVNPNTPARITLRSSNDKDYAETFWAEIALSEWRKFDYIDVYFSCLVASISSIDATLGSLSLPYELNYLESSFFPDSAWGSNVQAPPDLRFNCHMIIDLTGVNRSASATAKIHIEGLYEPYWVQGIELYTVTGLVIGNVPSELGTFWQRLQGLLVALFGSDPAAGDASTSHDILEQDTNEFIFKAVNDWDYNIDYASAEFENGFTFVSTSVLWISSLASKIFNSLGSFGSLYLVVGMMSVIMLLLSKSGVAAKLSGAVRRGSGGGNKNA